ERRIQPVAHFMLGGAESDPANHKMILVMGKRHGTACLPADPRADVGVGRTDENAHFVEQSRVAENVDAEISPVVVRRTVEKKAEPEHVALVLPSGRHPWARFAELGVSGGFAASGSAHGQEPSSIGIRVAQTLRLDLPTAARTKTASCRPWACPIAPATIFASQITRRVIEAFVNNQIA